MIQFLPLLLVLPILLVCNAAVAIATNHFVEKYIKAKMYENCSEEIIGGTWNKNAIKDRKEKIYVEIVQGK